MPSVGRSCFVTRLFFCAVLLVFLLQVLRTHITLLLLFVLEADNFTTFAFYSNSKQSVLKKRLN